MKFLKNFRRGFATNSSSSHSFVYMKVPQDKVGYDITNNSRGRFGWEDFRLNTVAEKVLYVAASRIGGGWGEDRLTAEQAMEKYGEEYPELNLDDFEDALNGYVDHDSVGTITLEQARDPYVVVFGGNDNSDGSVLRLAAEDEIDWLATPIGREEYIAETADRIRKNVKELLKAATSGALSTPVQPKKYHINAAGDVRTCNAKKRACPYGEADHFASRAEASKAIEERYS